MYSIVTRFSRVQVSRLTSKELFDLSVIDMLGQNSFLKINVISKTEHIFAQTIHMGADMGKTTNTAHICYMGVDMF